MIRNVNLGSFYRYVNNKTSIKSGVAPLQDSAGIAQTDDLSKANALNDYFASVFSTDNGSLPKSNDVNITQPDNNIEFVYFVPSLFDQ